MKPKSTKTCSFLTKRYRYRSDCDPCSYLWSVQNDCVLVAIIEPWTSELYLSKLLFELRTKHARFLLCLHLEIRVGEMGRVRSWNLWELGIFCIVFYHLLLVLAHIQRGQPCPNRTNRPPMLPQPFQDQAMSHSPNQQLITCLSVVSSNCIHPKKFSPAQTCTNPHLPHTTCSKTLPFCRSKSLGFHLVSVEISSALLSWAFCCISRKAWKCSWRLDRSDVPPRKLDCLILFRFIWFSFLLPTIIHTCVWDTPACWIADDWAGWSPVISQRAWECEGRNLDPQGLRLSSYNWLSASCMTCWRNPLLCYHRALCRSWTSWCSSNVLDTSPWKWVYENYQA